MNFKRIVTLCMAIVVPLIIMEVSYIALLWGLLAIGKQAGACAFVIKIIGGSILSIQHLSGVFLLWRYIMECLKLERMKEKNNCEKNNSEKNNSEKN